jgi:tetratricopeptide (TPR) repeat protein
VSNERHGGDQSPPRLTRDSVPELVRALNDESPTTTPRWNVVEALELLIDSGNFMCARSLAKRIIPLVNEDGRERLFKGYFALCELMIVGDSTRGVSELESLYVEINHNGHSLADRVRVALLLSRGLSVCVGMGVLPEGAILRARNVLHVEFSRAIEQDHAEFQCVLAAELAKSYLHAPTSDPRAAHAILSESSLLDCLALVPVDVGFDVRRIAYQARKALVGTRTPECSEEQLRSESLVVGGVARALAELAIARRAEQPCEDSLLRSAELFEDNRFISGAFEARFILGSHALDRGHNSVAERHLRRAALLADEGGFLHGQLLARVGLFQAALIGGQDDLALERCDELSRYIGSEVAVAAVGLNVSAANQIVGRTQEALELARRCEKLFSDKGIANSDSQALHVVGSCHARQGSWGEALAAWERAVEIDVSRSAFIPACERCASIVQALVMRDVTAEGEVASSTATRCQEKLDASYQMLRRFGHASDAKRIEARLRTVNAQLCVMTRNSVTALRHTSVARDLFETLAMEYEMALVDALAGLAMIEVGKAGGVEMVEEAVLTLQRPLQFFVGSEYCHIRWKILYYLAVAGVVISQRKALPLDKLKWKDLATAWLKEASRELSQVPEARAVSMNNHDTEFSPGLKPAALDALKATLGVGTQKPRRAQRGATLDAGPGDGYIH